MRLYYFIKKSLTQAAEGREMPQIWNRLKFLPLSIPLRPLKSYPCPSSPKNNLTVKVDEYAFPRPPINQTLRVIKKNSSFSGKTTSRFLVFSKRNFYRLHGKVISSRQGIREADQTCPGCYRQIDGNGFYHDLLSIIHAWTHFDLTVLGPQLQCHMFM